MINKVRSTQNELTSNYSRLTTKAIGFTMAEILLSLTIIGVVAAITLPSLTGNINERTWNTQRKALYSRMSQAISLMPALNGYGQIKAESSEGAGDAVDTATETFLTAGLSKVLKINNVCADNLADCGIVTTYTNFAGTKQSIPTDLYSLNAWFSFASNYEFTFSTKNTKAVAFETQNGESLVAYYNQACKTQYLNTESPDISGNVHGFPEAIMCVNFIYDLNGKKGPNTVGKDMGTITVFNATDSIVVAPLPSAQVNAGGNTATHRWVPAQSVCSTEDSDSRLPNIHELSAMMVNKDLINLVGGGFWSSTLYDADRAWDVLTDRGTRAIDPKVYAKMVRCVKR